MSDFWILLNFKEGHSNLEGPIYTWTVEDDYYDPVMVTKTREELVSFLEDTGKKIEWNGNVAAVDLTNWKGEEKGKDIFVLLPGNFGELIAYHK
jgi:hypothetical protein